MPSTIASFAEFDRRLQAARKKVDALAAQMPDDSAVDSIKKQLDAVDQWTRGGREPAQSEKDQLSFGMLARRFLGDVDDDLTTELAELASYITYW